MIARHKDAVYRQIARVCGNYDDTEDVLVETFLAAYRAMDQVRDPDSMRAWLATIGRRICRRMKAREALTPILQLAAEDEPSELPDFDEVLEESRMSDCVLQALQHLPENYRQVYILRDLQGDSAEEASQKLGISVRNLKSRLHRARKRIRESLDAGLCGAGPAE